MILLPSRFELSVRPDVDGVHLSSRERFDVPSGSAQEYSAASKGALSMLSEAARVNPDIRVLRSGHRLSKSGQMFVWCEVVTSPFTALTLLFGEVATQVAGESSWQFVAELAKNMGSAMNNIVLVPPGKRPESPLNLS